MNPASGPDRTVPRRRAPRAVGPLQSGCAHEGCASAANKSCKSARCRTHCVDAGGCSLSAHKLGVPVSGNVTVKPRGQRAVGRLTDVPPPVYAPSTFDPSFSSPHSSLTIIPSHSENTDAPLSIAPAPSSQPPPMQLEFARPIPGAIDPMYGKPVAWVEAHERIQQRVDVMAGQRKVAVAQQNTVRALLWVKQANGGVTLHHFFVMINGTAGTFTVSDNENIMSRLIGKYIDIYFPGERQWYECALSTTIEGPFTVESRILLRTPGVCDAECAGLDEELTRLFGGKRPRLHSPDVEREHKRSGAGAYTTTATRTPPVTPSTTPHFPSTPTLSQPPMASSDQGSLRQRHVCSLAPVLDLLLVPDCNVAAIALEHFTHWSLATVYRLRRVWATAFAYKIISKYVEAGRTEHGEWSRMTGEIRCLLRGNKPFMRTIKVGRQTLYASSCSDPPITPPSSPHPASATPMFPPAEPSSPASQSIGNLPDMWLDNAPLSDFTNNYDMFIDDINTVLYGDNPGFQWDGIASLSTNTPEDDYALQYTAIDFGISTGPSAVPDVGACGQLEQWVSCEDSLPVLAIPPLPVSPHFDFDPSLATLLAGYSLTV